MNLEKGDLIIFRSRGDQIRKGILIKEKTRSLVVDTSKGMEYSIHVDVLKERVLWHLITWKKRLGSIRR